MSKEKQSFDWESIKEEFKGDSDRAVAIVGAAMLDEGLRRMLEDYFSVKKGCEKLFKSQGIPDSLHGKIMMAYRLGLISEEHKADLELVQQIRNKFAHEISNLSFEQSQISEWCKGMLLPKRVEPSGPRDKNRSLYLASVATLLYIFSIPHHAK